jgi:hypothetical protein
MNPTVTLTCLAFLMAGCASHGNWSESDGEAWASLDTIIGHHDQNYYVKAWGQPVARRNMYFTDGNGNNTQLKGEELLWLWKGDGTGPSDQPGKGWELFLEFDEQGQCQHWRVGSYRKRTKRAAAASDSLATSRGLLGRGFLDPSLPKGDGPGIDSDGTGRPFTWRPSCGGPREVPLFSVSLSNGTMSDKSRDCPRIALR